MRVAPAVGVLDVVPAQPPQAAACRRASTPVPTSIAAVGRDEVEVVGWFGSQWPSSIRLRLRPSALAVDVLDRAGAAPLDVDECDRRATPLPYVARHWASVGDRLVDGVEDVVVAVGQPRLRDGGTNTLLGADVRPELAAVGRAVLVAHDERRLRLVGGGLRVLPREQAEPWQRGRVAVLR